MLLFTLQYRGVIFYVIGCLNSFLKPKVHNVATIFAFAFLLLQVFIYGQSFRCMFLPWYYSAVLRKLIQDKGRLTQSYFL